MQDVWLDSIEIGSCYVGIAVQKVSNLLMTNIDCINCGSDGFQTAPGTYQFIDGITSYCCQFDTCSGSGWHFYSNGGQVNNCRLVAPWGSSNTNHGMLIDSVNNLTVQGGQFINNTLAGIFLNAGLNVQIANCTTAYNSQIGSGTWHGITVQAGVSNFQLLGNQSGAVGQVLGSNKQGYGIFVLTGASNNYMITGNSCNGNVTGGIIDAGSGGNKVVTNNLTW